MTITVGTVRFYGASDDLIEVEGDVGGCDEYVSEIGRFVAVGPGGKTRVGLWYTRRGVWAIEVAPVGEGVPMLATTVTGHDNGYSAAADVEGVELVVHEATNDA